MKSSDSTLQLGFIGLGAMGGAVAQRLVSGPWQLSVYDLLPQAAAGLVQAGAQAAPDAASAVAGKQVVFSCLPTPELVEKFWQEHHGKLADGAIAVDLSTIDPATSRHIGNLIEKNTGASFVACTLGKTPALAQKGEIPVFVGGPPSAIAKLDPLLKHISNAVFNMGSVEGATMFKLISNLIGMTNLTVIAEGYALAKAAGIDGQTFAEALKTTGGWSTQADIRLNWMMNRDFTPRFSVDLAAKDLRLSVNMAATWGVPTPVAAAGLSVFSLARAAGLGRQDAASVIETIMPQC